MLEMMILRPMRDPLNQMFWGRAWKSTFPHDPTPTPPLCPGRTKYIICVAQYKMKIWSPC